MPEIMWAPWRMTYVTEPSTPGSSDFFIELPAQNDDERNLILHRGARAFVMLNRYPYTTGHLMVAPYRQVANLAGLDDGELLEINQLLAKCETWLTAVYQPHGFNVGVNLGREAGAGAPRHIHWHLLPRWAGDHNFLSTVGDTRVIPEALAETYRRLREVVGA